MPAYSLFKRFRYCIRLWRAKISAAISFRFSRFWHPLPASHLPFQRTYAVRPSLHKTRIFLPPCLTASASTSDPNSTSAALFPLYLNVHGGGWAILDPDYDDEFCSFLASRLNAVVASLDYHKTPSHAFPTPIFDIAALANAIIRDPSLNIDAARVVIGGFSAGGNLALAAAQLPQLARSFRGVVAVYPVCDVHTEEVAKVMRAPGFGVGTRELQKAAPAQPTPSDPYQSMIWGYVPAGWDLRDPLLSPVFAQRERLPENVLLISAEKDLFAREAKEMAENLRVQGGRGEVRWDCIEGMSHAFTHATEVDGEAEAKRKKAMDEMYESIAVWLEEKSFS